MSSFPAYANLQYRKVNGAPKMKAFFDNLGNCLKIALYAIIALFAVLTAFALFMVVKFFMVVIGWMLSFALFIVAALVLSVTIATLLTRKRRNVVE